MNLNIIEQELDYLDFLGRPNSVAEDVDIRLQNWLRQASIALDMPRVLSESSGIVRSEEKPKSPRLCETGILTGVP